MITVRKSPTADTRTCDFTKVSKETLFRPISLKSSFGSTAASGPICSLIPFGTWSLVIR